MIGKIIGTGSFIPEKQLDNHDIAKLVDTSDEWIRERTGITRRHIADKETTAHMAVKAAKAALEDSNTKPSEIDMIIVCTISPANVLPCTACEVQKDINASNAVCFDLNAACTGFLFAYNTVLGYLQTGMVKKALIIGAESLSKLLDWTDRGTCILFGDGAGAAVIEAAEGKLQPFIMHSDGMKGDALSCASGETIYMDGRSVFEFAVRRVPECIQELLVRINKKQEEIDYFILHQANKRIVEAVAKRLHADINKFPVNLEEYGNTSSASIPILLDELNKSKKLKRGSRLVLVGFGAGLSWGASYLEW